MRSCAAAIGIMLAAVSCRPNPNEPLAPPDSYLLFAPLPHPGGDTQSVPLVSGIESGEPAAQPLERVFADGFAAEMLRTVYLLKQLVRELSMNGRGFPEDERASARDALYVVIGLDSPSMGRGLGLSGSWFGGPALRPQAAWVALPGNLENDRALTQTVSARLADFIAGTVVRAGKGAPAPATPIEHGYRTAMEVIAREWRVGSGPAGVVPYDAGTPQQREIFARVRENRYVLNDDGSVKPAAALLADPGVAATVMYRMAQARGLAQRVAPEAFYAPIASNRIPEHISPAAVLGPFRNFQIKLLSSWSKAILAGKPPRTIIDLIEAYRAQLPAENADVVRIFIVTTFGSTVKAGGVSTRPSDARAALAELTTLAAEVSAGRRSLAAALAPGGGAL